MSGALAISIAVRAACSRATSEVSEAISAADSSNWRSRLECVARASASPFSTFASSLPTCLAVGPRVTGGSFGSRPLARAR